MNNIPFKTEFCNVIDQCHGKRPDKLWFSTWMSSKSPYFTFPQNFEKFWLTNSLPAKISFIKKIKMTLRQGITLCSVLVKYSYLRVAMRKELSELSALRGKKIQLMRTFSYHSHPELKDPFWGDLIEINSKSSIPLLTIYDPGFSIFKCKSAYSANIRNFPYLIFLSPFHLFSDYLSLLKEAFFPMSFNSLPVNNINIESFLVHSYQSELLSPASFINLVFFRSFQNVMKIFSIEKAYLTFENNPWEKMFHLAKKSSMENFETIGFQHASIQEGAANYLLSSYEAKSHLHPDRILSVGEYTYKYMKSLPHYKNINIQIGCALRYSYLDEKIPLPIQKKTTDIHLLVMLDGVLDTVNLIELALEFAHKNTFQNLKIIVKEHPNLLLKNFYQKFFTHEAVLASKIVISQGKLRETLEWADLILYTGTTSSIEALKMGKAIINYNFSLFNYDPLFQFTEFKWQADNCEDLKNIIHSYLELSSNELMQKKVAAKKFVNSYFSPCTRENIERFL